MLKKIWLYDSIFLSSNNKYFAESCITQTFCKEDKQKKTEKIRNLQISNNIPSQIISCPKNLIVQKKV